jgi:hypothetical protein
LIAYRGINLRVYLHSRNIVTRQGFAGRADLIARPLGHWALVRVDKQADMFFGFGKPMKVNILATSL